MKIKIWFSKITVHDYRLGDCPKLESIFTIYDQVRHERYYKGITYDYDNRILYLPRGMDVNWVSNLLGGVEIETMMKSDNIILPKNTIMMSNMPKSKTQEEALYFVLGIQGYERNREKTQISVNVNTGVGKTYIAIAASAFLNMKEMIITHTKDMMLQWKDEIMSFTNTRENEIYLIDNGSRNFNMVLNGTVDTSKYKYFIVSHSAINSFGNQFGWDSVTKFFETVGIGIKVFDEAHKYFDNMIRIDYATNTWKTIYLTATPERSDKKENQIYQNYFRYVPAISLFNEEEDPRTHYIAIHYSSRPSLMDIKACENYRGGGISMFNAPKYADYVVKRPNFYKLLFILVELARARGKTIFYIENNNSIEVIYNWIIYTFPDMRDQVGIYNSTIPYELKQSQIEKQIILTTVKSCGEGKHIDHLALGVILAAPYSSKPLLRQMLGRMRDYGTMLIYCIDNGFSKIRAYYRSTLGMFTKYALDVADLDLMNEKLDQMYMERLAYHNSYYEQLYSQTQKNKIVVAKILNEDIL